MRGPAKWMIVFGVFVSLAGCKTGGNELAARTMPPITERTYKIKGQTRDISYVPVLRGEHAEWKARMEDTLGPVPTLDACKQALAAHAAKPLTGHWKDYKITDHVCFEVKKSGGQREIVVGQGSRA